MPVWVFAKGKHCIYVCMMFDLIKQTCIHEHALVSDPDVSQGVIGLRLTNTNFVI